MEFSDTFQSRPLVLTPTNNPCLFTEKILRVTDHHFFEKLFTAGKMAFYNLGRDLGVWLRRLEYRLVYQALYNFETATVITVVRVTKVIVENCT